MQHLELCAGRLLRVAIFLLWLHISRVGVVFLVCAYYCSFYPWHYTHTLENNFSSGFYTDCTGYTFSSI